MIHSKLIINYIITWLKKYIKKSKSNGFILGISGGIDSALTSTLVAMTKKPTLILEMPILDKKNNLSKQHIQFLKKKFENIYHLEKNLYQLYILFSEIMDEPNQIKQQKYLLALANLQSRLRMITLYYYANIHNYLVVGTGNKIEDFGVGFFTKYGDGGVDILPIGDLTKSEVKILSKELNIISSIQNAIPKDGLWQDQRSDEDQLNATYKELEWAMKNDKNHIRITNKKYNIINIYKNLHQKNQHKMISIPICVIPNTFKY
ncbi:NAD(+) synthase [Blattabacterium cuenoti]|uniref:NAD(+) synthase n=1 Tax=Blattabacterium cuenoti TaxID=1653831 RepID=UPI00163D300C|nr:NAD(+) synthase [Blattabacterium cuenoti]